MKLKVLITAVFVLAIFISCEDDDTNTNGIGVVNFSSSELTEVENATLPLNINIGIESYNHAGGSISVEITGGEYGVDFETSTGSASFPLTVEASSLLSTFSITPIDDEVIEQDKVLTITLTSVSGSLQLGENTSMTFTILDNDDPLIALVAFENATTEVQENDASSTLINIPFNQSSTNGGTMTVEATGDAVFGTDYSVTGQSSNSFSIVVPAGATASSLELQPIDNAVFEANKTIVLTITETTGGLSPGVITQNTVTIVNDDLPPNPLIDFSASNTLTYNEGVGTITLNFDISQATTSDATIELTTSGSATTSDFNFGGSTANPYSFVIPSGSTSGSVDITIVDDGDIETDETIVLDITSVSGGLDVGVNLQTQTLTILDNDNAAFNYVETFETTSDLESIGFEAFLLPAQDLPSSKLFKYNMNTDKYSDVDDVTQPSDSGLVVFYSNTQNGNGIIDNVVITPQMEVIGNVDVSIDITYSQAPEFNNAVVTFYYSEMYDGSGTWNESDWITMGTETAADLNTEGYGTNDYKRKVMNITPNSNFYVAVRVNQTIDDTFFKTQWRLDNFKVNN